MVPGPCHLLCQSDILFRSVGFATLCVALVAGVTDTKVSLSTEVTNYAAYLDFYFFLNWGVTLYVCIKAYN
jgi:hypothetical protein